VPSDEGTQELKQMKENKIQRIDARNRMFIVICGGNEIRKDGHSHAAVCFDIDVAIVMQKRLGDRE
jgi:hypothetical protein